ncbi:MAG: PEP-CTERM sorting domain-containing protein [Myxococcota bacterium]
MLKRTLAVAVAIPALWLTSSPHAALIGYTSKAAYDAATAGFSDAQTVDFEGVASGTSIPSGSTISGLEFTYSIPGYSLQVSSTFGTTSGSNYLGLDNPDTAFNLGDSFSIQFGRTVHAAALYVIAGGDTQAGDFELSAGTGSVLNDAVADALVGDGSAWFLGLVETSGAGFTSATLRGVDAGGAYLAFSVDDIRSAVPEPGSAPLVLAGLAALAVFTNRKEA